MKKRNAKKGFTIVELVIVIAVIAILAAVLIPTFSNVVENAKKSAAFQEAKNAWTEYLATIDYTQAEPEKDLVIVVDGYYVTVESGKIATTAVKGAVTVAEGKTAIDTNTADDASVYKKADVTLPTA